jgi:hypothetical protein
MHGLFVREVLKRQRDSIRGLNALTIPPLYLAPLRQKCCKIREPPSP